MKCTHKCIFTILVEYNSEIILRDGDKTEGTLTITGDQKIYTFNVPNNDKIEHITFSVIPGYGTGADDITAIVSAGEVASKDKGIPIISSTLAGNYLTL